MTDTTVSKFIEKCEKKMDAILVSQNREFQKIKFYVEKDIGRSFNPDSFRDFIDFQASLTEKHTAAFRALKARHFLEMREFAMECIILAENSLEKNRSHEDTSLLMAWWDNVIGLLEILDPDANILVLKRPYEN